MAARDILIKLEKWLLFDKVSRLLLSFDRKSVEEAVILIENVIDDIDDHNQDANPCKDIVTVSKARYRESFPASVQVFDKSFTTPEVVTNPKFDQIPKLLQARSNRSPVVITSVRKSTASGQLRFGMQYIVDGADKEGVRIHYEHEGNGDTLIPKKITDNLFSLRNVLAKRDSSLEQEKQEVCMR